MTATTGAALVEPVEATAAVHAPEAAVIAAAPEVPAQEAVDSREASAGKVAPAGAKGGRMIAVLSIAIVLPSLLWHRQTSGWSFFQSRAAHKASLAR